MSADLPAPAAPVLQAKALARSFGGLKAVDGVNLEVAPGALMGIIGPNGAGKSTLFNLLAGELSADAGTIRLDEQDVTSLSAFRRARLGIGRTFQSPRPIARLSVMENLLLAGKQQLGEHFWAPLVIPQYVRRAEDLLSERAAEMMQFFELTQVQDDYAGSLSGGQKKLLDLARALMMEPRIMLLDEPMAGVNPTLARKLMDKIENLRRNRGITFLLVEHDLETVYARCDPIMVMADGRVLAQGNAKEIRRNQDVVDAYLGGAA